MPKIEVDRGGRRRRRASEWPPHTCGWQGHGTRRFTRTSGPDPPSHARRLALLSFLRSIEIFAGPLYPSAGLAKGPREDPPESHGSSAKEKRRKKKEQKV